MTHRTILPFRRPRAAIALAEAMLRCRRPIPIWHRAWLAVPLVLEATAGTLADRARRWIDRWEER